MWIQARLRSERGEVVELGLLADPEDAVGHDAHEEDDEARREDDERAAEIVLGVDGLGGGGRGGRGRGESWQRRKCRR